MASSEGGGVAALLFALRGRLLGLACARLGQHLEGLSAAGRRLAAAGLIDGYTKRRLRELDVAVNFMRHISEPKCRDFYEQ
eukprot:12596748-Alexandrium_andersonii.AAC.1